MNDPYRHLAGQFAKSPRDEFDANFFADTVVDIERSRPGFFDVADGDVNYGYHRMTMVFVSTGLAHFEQRARLVDEWVS